MRRDSCGWVMAVALAIFPSANRTAGAEPLPAAARTALDRAITAMAAARRVGGDTARPIST